MQPVGYPPQGQHPPPPAQHQHQPGQYPPQQGQYPPQQGQYPPQPAAYPPQPGQYPPQLPGQPPAYNQTVVYGQPANVVQPATTTVVTTSVNRHPDSCAYCGGTRKDQATLLGIIFCLLFFPLGVICCIMMTERRCTSCGR